MEQELKSQPQVLHENSERYFNVLSEALSGMKPELVLMVARGSSDNAALYGRYLIESLLGIPVSLAAPSVITRMGSKMHYPKTLAIAISQSGAGPDVSEVISYLRRAGHATLGITNTPKSRLTDEAEYVLELGAGEERAVAATKTYTASLLALYQIVRALGADIPEPVLPTQAWVDETQQTAEQAVGPILRSNLTFSLSRGYNFSTAHETALKMVECALLPCKAYSTADFAHGPRALATHGTTAIIYGEVPGNLAETGCEVIEAPCSTVNIEKPLWDVLFGQWLALLCARARGLDPDSPAGLSKVTKTL